MTDLHPDTIHILRNPYGFSGPTVSNAIHNAANMLEALQVENNTLRRALEEIREECAGAECGEPVHAQEAYAIGLAKRMYALAVEGLVPNTQADSPAKKEPHHD